MGPPKFCARLKYPAISAKITSAAFDLPSLAFDTFRLMVDEDEWNILGFVDIDLWISSVIRLIPMVPVLGSVILALSRLNQPIGSQEEFLCQIWEECR
jgi:hypothetical protein